MLRRLAQIAVMCLLAGHGLAAEQAGGRPDVAPQTAATQLQPYRSHLGRFRVDFPAGKPQHSVIAITLKGGASSMLHQTWVKPAHGNAAYMVMYNDYPADYVSQAAEDVLAAARSGAVEGKTVLCDRPISLEGVPGRAFTATDRGGWHYVVRQFLAGQRLYQLIVVSDKAQPEADAEAFLGSFRIR